MRRVWSAPLWSREYRSLLTATRVFLTARWWLFRMAAVGSVCGFVIGFGIVLGGELEDPCRGNDLRLGRLQNRIPAGCRHLVGDLKVVQVREEEVHVAGKADLWQVHHSGVTAVPVDGVGPEPGHCEPDPPVVPPGDLGRLCGMCPRSTRRSACA